MSQISLDGFISDADIKQKNKGGDAVRLTQEPTKRFAKKNVRTGGGHGQGLSKADEESD